MHHRKCQNIQSIIAKLLPVTLVGFCLSASAEDILAKGQWDLKFDNQTTFSTLTKPLRDIADAVSVSKGISARDFSWSIAASSSNTNTISELEYENLALQTTEISIDFNSLTGDHTSVWQVTGTLGYGSLDSGQLTDSDYSATSAGTLTHQSTANLDQSKSYFTDIAFTKDISNEKNRSLELVTGAHWQSDLYIQREGQHSFNNGNQLTLPLKLEGLDSQYQAHWFGPFIGINHFIESQNNHISIGARVSANGYYGEGLWNLRSDLAQPKSFEHKAFGVGFSLNAQYEYRISNHISIHQSANIDHHSMLTGNDRVFRANGTQQDTPLNTVERTSLSYNIGFILKL